MCVALDLNVSGSFLQLPHINGIFASWMTKMAKINRSRTRNIDITIYVTIFRIKRAVIALVFNAKSFAIDILVFFSFSPSLLVIWTESQELFSKHFKIRFQESA